MIRPPFGLRLRGAGLSEAVGIFAEHYDIRREDAKLSIAHLVVNSIEPQEHGACKPVGAPVLGLKLDSPLKRLERFLDSLDGEICILVLQR